MKQSRLPKFLHAFILTPLLTGAAFFGSISSARAVSLIDCSFNSVALVNLAAAGPLNGSFAIKGLCVGDVTILNSDAVIKQDPSGGTIAGALFVIQSSVELDSITLDGTTSLYSGISINDVSGGALPTAHRPSTVTLVNVTVQNYPMFGIAVANGTLLVNGGAISLNQGCGIFARYNARVEVSNSTTITGNGSNSGTLTPDQQCGVHGEDGAALVIHDSVAIHDNSGPALWLVQASADVRNASLESSAPASFPAIFAQRGSLNLVDTVVDGGIFADSGSSITARHTTIDLSQQYGPGIPTLFVVDGSQFISLGGNWISHNQGPGSIALTLQNGSVYRQRNESMFFGPLQADSIGGSAFVQVQSALELGTGLVSGYPSVSWTLLDGNCILVQQNSSIRLSGGVEFQGAGPGSIPGPCTLSGAVAAIVIQQESNGFFNLSQGGTNVFTEGAAGVSCLFAGMPNAHVTGKANITPANAQPVVIGSLSQALTATSPGCLGP